MTCVCRNNCCEVPHPERREHECGGPDCKCDELGPIECTNCGARCFCVAYVTTTDAQGGKHTRPIAFPAADDPLGYVPPSMIRDAMAGVMMPAPVAQSATLRPVRSTRPERRR